MRTETPATKNLASCSRTVLSQAPPALVLAMVGIATLSGCTCPPLKAFTGRVVDQDDRPVAGLRIRVPNGDLRGVDHVVTDEDGRYGWPGAKGEAAGELCVEDPQAPENPIAGTAETCTRRAGGDVAPEAGTTKAWCCPRAADLSIRGTVVDGQGIGVSGARASIQVKFFRHGDGFAQEVVLSGDSSADGSFDLKVDSELQLSAERLFAEKDACGLYTLAVSREGCASVSKAIEIGWEPSLDLGSVTLVCSAS